MNSLEDAESLGLFFTLMDFESTAQTVNQLHSTCVLRYLLENVYGKHAEKWCTGDCFLHHDNALNPSTLTPYFRDLALCGFSLCAELKLAHKGKMIIDIIVIIKVSHTKHTDIKTQDFHSS
jgi:hypothetical protein